jgi:hypothetical protein
VALAPTANPEGGQHVDIGAQVMSGTDMQLDGFYFDGVRGATSALMIRADTGNVSKCFAERGYIEDGNVGQPAIYADQVSGHTIEATLNNIKVKRNAWASPLRQAGNVKVTNVGWE